MSHLRSQVNAKVVEAGHVFAEQEGTTAWQPRCVEQVMSALAACEVSAQRPRVMGGPAH